LFIRTTRMNNHTKFATPREAAVCTTIPNPHLENATAETTRTHGPTCAAPYTIINLFYREQLCPIQGATPHQWGSGNVDIETYARRTIYNAVSQTCRPHRTNLGTMSEKLPRFRHINLIQNLTCETYNKIVTTSPTPQQTDGEPPQPKHTPAHNEDNR